MQIVTRNIKAIEFACALAEAFPKEAVEPFGDFLFDDQHDEKDERIEGMQRPTLRKRLFNVCCIASASRQSSPANGNDFQTTPPTTKSTTKKTQSFANTYWRTPSIRATALGGEKYLAIVSNLFQQNGNQFEAVDVALFV